MPPEDSDDVALRAAIRAAIAALPDTSGGIAEKLAEEGIKGTSANHDCPFYKYLAKHVPGFETSPYRVYSRSVRPKLGSWDNALQEIILPEHVQNFVSNFDHRIYPALRPDAA